MTLLPLRTPVEAVAAAQRGPGWSSVPIALATDGTHIWIAQHRADRVARVRIGDAAQIGSLAVAKRPSALLMRDGELWVASSQTNVVQRFNPWDGRLLGSYRVGGQPAGLAGDRRSVWVSNSADNTVTRVNAVTGLPIGTYPCRHGARRAWRGMARTCGSPTISTTR
ncbi:MAG: hypothetical protein MZW92_36930 [Comamonadaceae bacterium]|nr:hypothetical protein [Comamonadaceae bacterium]